jgi:hypothetical protein
MLTYKFHTKTREFLYAEKAFLDPLETKAQGKKVYLLPADSTFSEPLALKENAACVWNGKAWELVEDYRGKVAWKSYDESIVIKDLGPIPSGYSLVRPEKVLTDEEQKKIYENAVQAHLDATAQSHGYDNTYTCLSYRDSSDEKWKREANIFNLWRDSVWHKAHEILDAVMCGAIPQPTIEEVIAQLPKIEW